MEKVPDLDTFLKKMNKEIIPKDLNNRNYHIKDFKRFKKHILEIHEENGFFFRVDQKFRENLLKIQES